MALRDEREHAPAPRPQIRTHHNEPHQKVEKRILPSGLITFRAPYIDATGERRSQNFPTRQEARRFLLTVGGELRLGIHTPSSVSPTIAEAAELWLADCERRNLEPTTIDNYEPTSKLHILPLLGEMKLSALTAPAVRAFADQLHEAGRSADMVRRVLISLGSLFKAARQRGLVATAPTAGINQKKGDRDNPRPVIPSKAELEGDHCGRDRARSTLAGDHPGAGLLRLAGLRTARPALGGYRPDGRHDPRRPSAPTPGA